MSIFDRLRGKKKELELPEMPHDEPSFQKLHGGLAPPEDSGPSFPSNFAPSFQPPSFQQQQFPSPPPGDSLQVVSAKMDTLKVQLDAILSRLENIEKKLQQSDEGWKRPYR